MSGTWGAPTERSRVSRRVIVAAMAFALIVIAAAAVVNFLPGATAPSAAPGASQAAHPISTPSVSPIGPVTPVPSSEAPVASPPNSVGPRITTEVQPGRGTEQSTLSLGVPLGPLFSGPMPKSASAAGSIVAGFPSTIPIAPTSKISNSSVSSSGDILQVTLTAKSAANAEDVISYFRSVFAKVQLPLNPLPSIGGSTAVSFSRGSDRVTLTVTPDNSGSRYTIFGVLVVPG